MSPGKARPTTTGCSWNLQDPAARDTNKWLLSFTTPSSDEHVVKHNAQGYTSSLVDYTASRLALWTAGQRYTAMYHLAAHLRYTVQAATCQGRQTRWKFLRTLPR